jgi:methylenetetrahydrofolate reductase (NADPH)
MRPASSESPSTPASPASSPSEETRPRTSVGDEFLGELRTAGELVQLTHHVQRERVPYAQVDAPGSPGAKRIWSADDVTIAVAAFPNGHPRARPVRQDLDSLLAKDAAGANLAITQLFFVPTTTSSFVDRARSVGVSMRIIPGIMPVVSPRQLRRVVELAGNALPMDILREFESAPDEATQCARGINRATALTADVLAGGADGVHLYTFNQHSAVLAVLRKTGVIDSLKEDA